MIALFSYVTEGASGFVHEDAIADIADSLAVFHNRVSGVGGATMALDVSFCKPIPLETCTREDCYEASRKGREVQRKDFRVDGIDKSVVYAVLKYCLLCIPRSC